MALGRSVNFITAHDGFTLADLVSYNRKHNLANGEDNRDGENHNNSWNHGIEGPSSNPLVQSLRRRQQRNLLSSLLLARGVPMLLMGDEVGRSQGGNNNSWCQNSPLGWMVWNEDQCDLELKQFLQRLLRLRQSLPQLFNPLGAAAGKQPQISGTTIGAAQRSLASMARGEPGQTRLGRLEPHDGHQPPPRQPRGAAVDGLQRLQGKPQL